MTLKYPIEHGIVTNWDDTEKIWHFLQQALSGPLTVPCYPSDRGSPQPQPEPSEDDTDHVRDIKLSCRLRRHSGCPVAVRPSSWILVMMFLTLYLSIKVMLSPTPSSVWIWLVEIWPTTSTWKYLLSEVTPSPPQPNERSSGTLLGSPSFRVRDSDRRQLILTWEMLRATWRTIIDNKPFRCSETLYRYEVWWYPPTASSWIAI